MTGTIANVEPHTCREPERRTGNINADNGSYCSFHLSDLKDVPATTPSKELVGRKVVFNIEHQSDATHVRFVDP